MIATITPEQAKAALDNMDDVHDCIVEHGDPRGDALREMYGCHWQNIRATLKHIAQSAAQPEPAEGGADITVKANEAIALIDRALQDAVNVLGTETCFHDGRCQALQQVRLILKEITPHPAKAGDKVCAEVRCPDKKCRRNDRFFVCRTKVCPMRSMFDSIKAASPATPLCDHPGSLPHLSENLGTLKGVPAEKLTGLKNRIAEYRAEMLDHFGEPVKGVKFREIEMLQYLELFAASPAAMERKGEG